MHPPTATTAIVDPGRSRAPDRSGPDGEMVVLLDERGRPCGEAPKAAVHGRDTRLHLAFSCYVVDRDGRVLLTRRSSRKRTWPGVWTNSCCGHPMPGETLRDAAARRVRQELGMRVTRIAMAFPDFSYRATMDDGTVENELCPVLVVEADGEPVLDPAEVDAALWVTWPQFLSLVRRRDLSPWSIAQAQHFDAIGAAPRSFLDGREPDASRVGAPAWADLDAPAVGPSGATVLGRGSERRLRPAVEEVLGTFLSARMSELAAVDPDALAIGEVVTSLVDAGGKRIRPEFAYWGHRASGAAHDDALFHVGAAVELLHTFALVHDDVMDRSDTRRGAPTAHVTLAGHHRAEGGWGDGEWFGTTAAIVAGDLAHVWAQQLFDAAPLSSASRTRARAVFSLLQSEVMAGQYLDLRLATRRLDGDVDLTGVVEEARRVALLKSGRYTVTRPLQLGAAVAGVDPVLDERLARYGDAIGVAFQMRDDLLGLVGDPDRTGKSCADDLREGKRTVLVLRTLARADARDRGVVLDALGDPHVDAAACERVRDIVEHTGARAEIEREIRALSATACTAIAAVPEPARSALLALARTATERDH
jgi:isopentenyl-diphosphate delta-isomerase type 1